VVLRNPLNPTDLIDYTIRVEDHELAAEWQLRLRDILSAGLMLEKNFCFMGFPATARTVEYLCTELNSHVVTINQEFADYRIEDVYTRSTVVAADLRPDHTVLNRLHNHFERLQGTVGQLSDYYIKASYGGKYAIRQLNNLCHELENLILSERKAIQAPQWTRPSQITTFLTAPRFPIKDSFRQGFIRNGYDRVLGGVYMHWAQIGKTLYEVFRDEGAPELTSTVCEAITELQYYSGEFDIDWGRDVVYGGANPWHDSEQDRFRTWLLHNNLDPLDPALSLGYLPLAQVDLAGSFGTDNPEAIWALLSSHLDIYRIECLGVQKTYDSLWTDANYKQQQIDQLLPGYDYQSRNSK